ncbi:zinc finger BED domain-containing protein 5-like [Tubulanus polymorphus]|uniref:zinc finger BED domain-containing protein 5-like n=1 Tax=Tubulanus polymorphus TaxID=672921 RepID=UPI003DA38BF9
MATGLLISVGSDSESSDSDVSELNTKAACPAKKKRRMQKFREEYSMKYPCIEKSSKSKHHAFCAYCKSDFTVAYGGVDDIHRHMATSKHSEAAKALNKSKNITSFFVRKEDLSVIRAETMFCEFLVEHNIPISAADHVGELARKMFPDSQIAKDYSSGRTKTTCIIKELAKVVKEKCVDALKTNPFVLGIDGSALQNNTYYPIVVRFIDTESLNCHTQLLTLPIWNSSHTGEAIFDIINQELNSNGIEWKQLLSLVCDNCSVMTGRNKGTIKFVHDKNSKVHLAGCICHLLDLACSKGLKCLSDEFNFDDILRKLYWYVSKSTKRGAALLQLQQDLEIPPHEVKKHVPT